METSDKFKTVRQADKAWVATFFGTSIGSGILFLPVITGMSGFYVSIIVMLLAFTTSYFAQKFYGVVLVRSEKAQSYNKAIEEYFGVSASSIISIIFIIFLFGGTIVFSTGLNTDIGEFLHYYNITSSNISSNPIFPLLLITAMAMVMIFSERLLLKVMDKLSTVLLVLLVIVAILFIPYWNMDFISNVPTDFKSIVKCSFKSFPLYMGALFFYQAISPMVMYYRKNYPELTKGEHERKVVQLNKFAVILLSFFTGLFILSSAFTLTPESIKYAYDSNISALAVLGFNTTPGHVLSIVKFLSYLVIFFALLTTFYGMSMGLIELLMHQIPLPSNWKEVSKKRIITIILMVFIWIFTTFNINVLGIMGMFSTPFNALILFLIPTGIILKSKRFKDYPKTAVFIILLIGIFTMFSYLLGTII